VDHVKAYWNSVFSEVVKGYTVGLTPNPDTLCNRHIKFGAFLREATSRFNADFVATGHYARITRGPTGNDPPALCCAVDASKDQTYFLSGIPSHDLERVLFPVGHLLKSEVREVARDAGLGWVAAQRESMGICFIGKRKFSDFVREYVPDAPGPMYVHRSIKLDNKVSSDSRSSSDDVSCRSDATDHEEINTRGSESHSALSADGEDVATHRGVHLYTIGQRAHLGGMNSRCFVAAKDLDHGVLHVVEDHNHPALLSSEILAGDCRWTLGRPPAHGAKVLVKVRHRMSPVAATLRAPLSDALTRLGAAKRPALRVVGHVPGKPSRVSAEWGVLTADEAVIVLDVPTMSVAPGQSVVVFDETNTVCLGGGTILDTVGVEHTDVVDVNTPAQETAHN